MVGGVLSDLAPPCDLFCIGLVLASLSNILFACSSSLLSFAVAWALNGLVQGLGWPSLANYVVATFSESSLGFVWSTLMFGSNLGYMVAPFLLLPLLRSVGWRVRGATRYLLQHESDIL